MTTFSQCQGYTHLHVHSSFMSSTNIHNFNLYCTSLLKAVFLMEDASQSIQAGAFYYSPNLITVYIPTTVKSIGLLYYYNYHLSLYHYFDNYY